MLFNFSTRGKKKKGGVRKSTKLLNKTTSWVDAVNHTLLDLKKLPFIDNKIVIFQRDYQFSDITYLYRLHQFWLNGENL